jgi:hypothetical protein
MDRAMAKIREFTRLYKQGSITLLQYRQVLMRIICDLSDKELVELSDAIS